jgi:SsrA-binding protein
MAKKKQTPEDKNYKVVAENRRARFDYAIESDLEVGVQLMGSEVKSLREGQANIAESYCEVKDGELWLVNGHIATYAPAVTWGHDERRRRKLLAKRTEIAKMWKAASREGYTIVPLVMYFNHRGIVKMKVGIAKGKNVADKRGTSAKRDWQRAKARLMKEHG